MSNQKVAIRNKKLEEAKNPDSKLTYTASPEGKILYEIQKEADKVFKKARARVGVSCSMSSYIKNQQDFLQLALTLQSFIKEVGEEFGFSNIRESQTLEICLKNN